MILGFYKEINPFRNTRLERLIALSKEAIKQGDKLIVFSLNDVNFEEAKIRAYVYDILTDKFKNTYSQFPDVIINEAPKLRVKRNPKENKLRELIPFTCYLIGNKFELYKKIKKYSIYDSYLIPTGKLKALGNVEEYLNTYKTIILKPLNGRQGKGIYKIYYLEPFFFIEDSESVKKVNSIEFHNFIDSLLAMGNYIVQPFIQCTTKDGNAYDFRIHTQRNSEGEWVVTKLYPRIGQENTFLSNISQGGHTEHIDLFLKKELGDKADFYKFVLNQLSLDLSEHIDSFYDFSIDELGIDLAIDNSGEVWFYEANAGPQSKYHEEERAVNTIGYAKYVGKNDKYLKSNENLQLSKKNNKVTIGMMTSRKNVTYFTLASAAAAKLYDSNYFYFTPDDINYSDKTIMGKTYENGEWVQKKYNYLYDIDVVFDRLRKKGRENYKLLYKTLEHIPFTHESFGTSINKLNLYKKFSKVKEINEHIIPFKEVKTPVELDEFLNLHKIIILKPLSSSQGNGVTYITKENDLIIIKDKLMGLSLNKVEYEEWKRELFYNNRFVAQKYIESRTLEDFPFDIRVHLVRNGQGGWSCAAIYPRIGFFYEKISGTGAGGYIGAIDGFLKRQFNESKAKETLNEIKQLSKKVVNNFELQYNTVLSEAGLDIVLDKTGQPYLLEVNVHQPGIVYYEFHLTKYMIPYAIYLAKKNREKINQEIY